MGMINGNANDTHPVNGPALAAFLAAGVGAFAMGLVVILNELGVFTAPSIYGPAGGLSGRTTIAAVLWLIAWAALHYRWKHRDLDATRVHTSSIALAVLGVVLCFPPTWSLL
jgi:hypothetical protein